MKTLSNSLSWLRVLADGNDLVVLNTYATWFGGDSDPEDNGETSSGVLTKGNPSLMGCALPLDGYGVASLKGSPLPKMPFGLHRDGTTNPDGAWVEVGRPGCPALHLPVIDLGPALKTRHGIDLTVAAFKALGVNLKDGIVRVSYRLIDGVLALTDAQRAELAAQPDPAVKPNVPVSQQTSQTAQPTQSPSTGAQPA